MAKPHWHKKKNRGEKKMIVCTNDKGIDKNLYVRKPREIAGRVR